MRYYMIIGMQKCLHYIAISICLYVKLYMYIFCINSDLHVLVCNFQLVVEANYKVVPIKQRWTCKSTETRQR